MDGFNDLQDLYQQVILDHGRNPRNFGEMSEPSGQAEGYNPLCGDQVTVYCKLADDTISQVAFTGKACAICTASASMMAQILKNKPISEANQMFETFHDMVTAPDETGDVSGLGKLAVFAGVRKYPMRVKCATLPWHTLQSSLQGEGDTVTTE